MNNDQELLAGLKDATNGLLFMSESDYPIEIVSWDVAITPELLRQKAATAADAPVEEQSLADFFSVAAGEQEWKNESQLATAKKYQALIQLLNDNLEGIRVYWIGRINMAVYVVGKSGSGRSIGVSTRVVET